MNLLPKNHEDFRQSEYWESFFKKRGGHSFEWYGEYGELCGILHKYIKTQDKVLVVGCGNSTLSEDLFDVGYKNITNIDLSETVIRQMRQKNKKKRPELIYQKMDVTEMALEDASFSVVLDKGTLDAMFPKDDSEAEAGVEKMFTEIDRILRVAGRYVCFSLLQEHILEYYVKWFENLGWSIRILRCREISEKIDDYEEWKFPVFALIATKFKKMTSMQTILEVGLSNFGHLTRLKTTAELIHSVRGFQQFAAARANKASLTSGDAREEEASLDLLDPISRRVKYSIYIVENIKVSQNSGIPYGVLIVPQGREVEWLFNSKDGRLRLAESASCRRLLIVHLHRDLDYISMDAIKDELSGYSLELAPSGLPADSQIPFLSVEGESNVSSRSERCRAKSMISGEFVVEDVKTDGEIYRRLLFFNNPKLIQSECRIKLGPNDQKIVDHTFLSCNHHSIMAGSFGFFPSNEKVSCLIVGLGGGLLTSYILENFKNVDIDAVEIDESIVRVAKEQFNLKPSDRLKIHIVDGLDFIEKCTSKFDVVILDVDSKDPKVGMSSPPEAFVKSRNLTKIRCNLSESGLFVLNLACRDLVLRQEVFKSIKAEFSCVVSHKIEEQVNEVLFCSTSKSKLYSTKSKEKKFSPIIDAFKSANHLISGEVENDPINIYQSMELLSIV